VIGCSMSGSQPDTAQIAYTPIESTIDKIEHEGAFGLYIHIPFCEKKCPYCDFNTYAKLDNLFQEYVDALCLELSQWGESLQGRSVDTIFLGGGTPTVLDEKALAQIFSTVHKSFQLASDCEITSEANPGTVDRPKFSVLRSLGVNRLSMGVQSFQPEELAFLGRIHSVEDVDRAFDAARQAGFENINLDFIFGLPDQPVTNWRSTLDRAIALGPDHLSLYSLIVEPNTPLFHWVESGSVATPDDDEAATHYEVALERMAEAGYLHYEVSNWARNTGERPVGTSGAQQAGMPVLACRHNLIYWRNQEYLGVGPGAHSYLRTGMSGEERLRKFGLRRSNRKPVPGYIKRLKRGESVEEFQETINAATSMGETMMLGLRLLNEGVSFAAFQKRYGVDLTEVYAAELQRFTQMDLLQVNQERVTLTRRGLMVGNQVFAEFLA
jgi:oxygen-independent coproporphyrinogen III oxidase